MNLACTLSIGGDKKRIRMADEKIRMKDKTWMRNGG